MAELSIKDLKAKKLPDLLKIIRQNDATIKKYLKRIYKDKPIPSKVLRSAREKGIEINGKIVNLRSGFPTQHKFNDLNFSLSSVTRYAESLDINPDKPKLPTWKSLGSDDIDNQVGMFKNSKEVRDFRSTGVFRGEFIDNLVNRQGSANLLIDELKRLRKTGEINTNQFDSGMESIFKRVNRYHGRKNVVGGKLKYNPNIWDRYGTPLDIDGNPKSPANFVKKMNKTWKDRGKRLQLIWNETDGLVLHQGHGVSAQQFGPNIFNVEAQPALALDLRGFTGAKGQSANIQQGERTIKSIDELRAANVATDIKEAYQHYLLDDYEGINKYGDLPEEWRVRRLHDPNWNPTAAEIEGLKARLTERYKRIVEATNTDVNKGGPTNEIISVDRPRARIPERIYEKPLESTDFWKIGGDDAQALSSEVKTSNMWDLILENPKKYLGDLSREHIEKINAIAELPVSEQRSAIRSLAVSNDLLTDGVDYNLGFGSDASMKLWNSLKTNWKGELFGAVADTEVHRKLSEGDYEGAAVEAGKGAVIGNFIQQGIRHSPKAINQLNLLSGWNIPTNIVQRGAPVVAKASAPLIVQSVADIYLKKATGKTTTEHVVDLDKKTDSPVGTQGYMSSLAGGSGPGTVYAAHAFTDALKSLIGLESKKEKDPDIEAAFNREESLFSTNLYENTLGIK